jgi:hypothetical protein
MNGNGLYRFKNGSLYEGEFKDNQFQGRGKLIDKLNDLVIVGEFMNNQPNGYSRVVYSDESEYDGPLKNGLREGKGTYKYAPNEAPLLYHGEFREDAYEGEGELSYKNKSKYVGNFKDNEFDGQGELRTAEFIYMGEFKMGRIEGQGVMKFANG